MAATLIAISLIMLLIIGLLGLFMAGKDSRSSNADGPHRR